MSLFKLLSFTLSISNRIIEYVILIKKIVHYIMIWHFKQNLDLTQTHEIHDYCNFLFRTYHLSSAMHNAKNQNGIWIEVTLYCWPSGIPKCSMYLNSFFSVFFLNSTFEYSSQSHKSLTNICTYVQSKE